MTGSPSDELIRVICTIADAPDEQRAAIVDWLQATADGRTSPSPRSTSNRLQVTTVNAIRAIRAEVGAPERLLALLVSAVHAARAEALAHAPRVELIWTGPSVTSAPLRSTRQALSQVVRESKQYILVVGYQLRSAGQAADSDLVEEFVSAARRGVRFTFVLNEDEANFAALDLARWPAVNRPRVLTWPLRKDDFASLHAKMVIADDVRALITSANLTFHGLSRNIEVGALIEAEVVVQLRRHFVELERQGILRPVERPTSVG